MKLTDLKVGMCLKHKRADYFLELIEISGETPNKFYVFEKMSSGSEMKLKCQYKYDDDSLFDNFDYIKVLPEEYLPF